MDILDLLPSTSEETVLRRANNLLPTPIVYSIPSYNQLRNSNFHLWDRNTKISSAEGLRGMLGRDIYNYIDQHPIRAYIQQKLELYQSSFSLTTIAKQIVKRLPGDYEPEPLEPHQIVECFELLAPTCIPEWAYKRKEPIPEEEGKPRWCHSRDLASSIVAEDDWKNMIDNRTCDFFTFDALLKYVEEAKSKRKTKFDVDYDTGENITRAVLLKALSRCLGQFLIRSLLYVFRTFTTEQQVVEEGRTVSRYTLDIKKLRKRANEHSSPQAVAVLSSPQAPTRSRLSTSSVEGESAFRSPHITMSNGSTLAPELPRRSSSREVSRESSSTPKDAREVKPSIQPAPVTKTASMDAKPSPVPSHRPAAVVNRGKAFSVDAKPPMSTLSNQAPSPSKPNFLNAPHYHPNGFGVGTGWFSSPPPQTLPLHANSPAQHGFLSPEKASTTANLPPPGAATTGPVRFSGEPPRKRKIVIEPVMENISTTWFLQETLRLKNLVHVGTDENLRQKEQITRLEKLAENAIVRIQELQNSLAMASNTSQAATADWEERYHMAEDLLAEKTIENQKLEREKEELREEMATLRDDHRERLLNEKAEQKAAMNKLERDIMELQNKLDEAGKTAGKSFLALQSVATELNNRTIERDELKEINGKEKEKLGLLQVELNGKKDELVTTEAAVKMWHHSCQEKEKIIDEMRGRINRLKATETARKQREKEEWKIVEELEKKKRLLAEQIQSNEAEAIAAQIKKLEKERDDEARERGLLYKKWQVSEARRRKKELELEEIQRTQSTAVGQVDQMEAAKKEKEELVRRHREELERMSNERGKMVEPRVFEELQGRCEEMKREIEMLKEQLQNLEAEKNQMEEQEKKKMAELEQKVQEAERAKRQELGALSARMTAAELERGNLKLLQNGETEKMAELLKAKEDELKAVRAELLAMEQERNKESREKAALYVRSEATIAGKTAELRAREEELGRLKANAAQLENTIRLTQMAAHQERQRHEDEMARRIAMEADLRERIEAYHERMTTENEDLEKENSQLKGALVEEKEQHARVRGEKARYVVENEQLMKDLKMKEDALAVLWKSADDSKMMVHRHK